MYMLYEYIVYIVLYADSMCYLCVVCVPYYGISSVSYGLQVYCVKCAMYDEYDSVCALTHILRYCIVNLGMVQEFSISLFFTIVRMG